MKKRIQIHTYGKVKQYGGTYKVGNKCEANMLQQNGWELIHRTFYQYHYMKPPEGKGCKRPIIEVEVPSDEELEALAFDLHKKGEDYNGEYKGWPISYTLPEVGVIIRNESEAEFDDDEEYVGMKTESYEEEVNEPARFSIGCWSVWKQSLRFVLPLTWTKMVDNFFAD